MSLHSVSLKHGLALAVLAALVAGCPTGSDSDPGTEDAGTLVDGGSPGDPPVADATATDATGTDATGTDSSVPPPACGRLTTLCKTGEKCAGAADCVSSVCVGGLCKAAAPADGVKNGDETDVDCGGSMAPACADGKACGVTTDCASGVCTNKVCQVPTSTDGVQNGNETGIDCGGSAPNKCMAGSGCLSNADCDKLKCDLVQKKCLVASHSDGVVNAGETGVDCGGSAPTKCPTGQGCVSNADCNAVACDVGATNLCLAASHTDGINNLGETGIDCGGAAPLKCSPGQGCAVDGDCANTRCNGGTLVCNPATKSDGLKNGLETDVDCGGGVGGTNAPACGTGLTCGIDNDCASKACNYAKKCVESRSCKVQHGGDTCGPTGNESCCVSLAAGAATIDKYNITAGRMRAFVTATGGDMRGYITANPPAGWNAAW